MHGRLRRRYVARMPRCWFPAGATRRRARGKSRPRCVAVVLRGGRIARQTSSLGALSDARGGVMSELLLDAAGRRRSPATLPDFHVGRPPRDKGVRYPADPPTVEEIVAVMRAAGDGAHGRRLRGLIVVLWRAGLRIHEALALSEADLDHRRGALLVRRGKGGRRREVGMDEWAWEQLQPWTALRLELPVGPLLCDQRPDTWAAMVRRCRARGLAPDGLAGGRSAALRAASA